MIDDFGFSLHTEAELKAFEQKLQTEIVIAEGTAEFYKSKVLELQKMIMPLLINLSKDPDKTWLHWPDRAVKMKDFINKVNSFVVTSTK